MVTNPRRLKDKVNGYFIGPYLSSSLTAKLKLRYRTPKKHIQRGAAKYCHVSCWISKNLRLTTSPIKVITPSITIKRDRFLFALFDITDTVILLDGDYGFAKKCRQHRKCGDSEIMLSAKPSVKKSWFRKFSEQSEALCHKGHQSGMFRSSWLRHDGLWDIFHRHKGRIS